jgi:hypothetical protein
MADIVPASEFIRNFGRYRMQAQCEAVAASIRGSITGYFIAASAYEEFLRFKRLHCSFATAELSDERVKMVGEARMDPRHAILDTMMDSE